MRSSCLGIRAEAGNVSGELEFPTADGVIESWEFLARGGNKTGGLRIKDVQVSARGQVGGEVCFLRRPIGGC